jgi:hypothetical protein
VLLLERPSNALKHVEGQLGKQRQALQPVDRNRHAATITAAVSWTAEETARHKLIFFAVVGVECGF